MGTIKSILKVVVVVILANIIGGVIGGMVSALFPNIISLELATSPAGHFVFFGIGLSVLAVINTFRN